MEKPSPSEFPDGHTPHSRRDPEQRSRPRLVARGQPFPRGRDEQLVQTRAAECAAGHLRHGQLDDGVEGTVRSEPLDRTTAVQRDPDAALGVDDETVRVPVDPREDAPPVSPASMS